MQWWEKLKEWYEPDYPLRGIPVEGTGETDHRGRKWPVGGCQCEPCRIAGLLLKN